MFCLEYIFISVLLNRQCQDTGNILWTNPKIQFTESETPVTNMAIHKFLSEVKYYLSQYLIKKKVNQTAKLLSHWKALRHNFFIES